MSTRSPISGVFVPLILAVALVVAFAAMLRQRAELNQTQAKYEQLLEETRTGGGSVASEHPGKSAGSEQAVVETTSDGEPIPAPEGEGARPPRVSAAKPAPSIFGPMQSTGLELAGAHAVPYQGGVKATMRFYPTQSEPPGMVSVIVRLPGDSESRILDLQPEGGGMQFTDIRLRVADDGKFAIWHGTAENADTLEVALTVSGDTVAEVRGTAGIGPFDLDISGIDAKVTPN